MEGRIVYPSLSNGKEDDSGEFAYDVENGEERKCRRRHNRTIKAYKWVNKIGNISFERVQVTNVTPCVHVK